MNDETAILVKDLTMALGKSAEFVAAWGNNHPDESGECNSIAKRQLERTGRIVARGTDWLEKAWLPEPPGGEG